MSNTKKEVKWFKTPKALIISKEYLKLSSDATRLLAHLLCLYNSFGRKEFFQLNDVLIKFTGLKYKRFLKAKNELRTFGVKIVRKANLWYYDLNDVYKKYIKISVENEIKNG